MHFHHNLKIKAKSSPEIKFARAAYSIPWLIGMQADAPKKKVKKTNVPVAEMVHGGMNPADLQKALEKEFEMALQDRVMEETKDKKNAVESYVYDMRNKVSCMICF